jgi:hypothetical protein
VVGAVGDDADGDPVRGVGAGERVDDVDVLLVEVGDDLLAETVELLLGQRLVDLAPPDAVLRTGLADDELVPRRASGVAAGVDDERPTLGEDALAARERVRVEERSRRLPVDAAVGIEPVPPERSLRRDCDR